MKILRTLGVVALLLVGLPLILGAQQLPDVGSPSSSGAPTAATYITQTAHADLSAEQALGALSSGIMRSATTTGVVTALTDSAGIFANVDDESGTGVLMGNISPSMTTPALGTPSALVLTNATGLPVTGLANGTDGELITWSAAGVAEAVAVGTATHVLTSNGVGVAPTFQAAAGGAAITATDVSLTVTDPGDTAEGVIATYVGTGRATPASNDEAGIAKKADTDDGIIELARVSYGPTEVGTGATEGYWGVKIRRQNVGPSDGWVKDTSIDNAWLRFLPDIGSDTAVLEIYGSNTAAGIRLSEDGGGTLRDVVIYKQGGSNRLFVGNGISAGISATFDTGKESFVVGNGTIASGLNVLGIVNATAPTASSNIAQFYATEIATRAEMLLMNELGEISQLSGDMKVPSVGVRNTAEGYTGQWTIQTTREVHTLAAAATSDTSSITIPAGAELKGCSLNVNTAVSDDGGNDTWAAAFVTGSTTEVAAAGTAAAQNTKVDILFVSELTTNTTEIRFTAQGGSFDGGVIEIVCYYVALTSIANV